MKNKLNTFVVIAFAITTILFGNTMKAHASTRIVKRTTASFSYIDFWEYNDPAKKGTYRAQGQALRDGILPTDLKPGQSIGYNIPQTYYRGLAANERAIDVRVVPGSIGNVSRSEFDASQYANYNTGNWDDYRNA